MKKFDDRIHLSTPTIHTEEIEFVNSAFETNWIAPLGPNVDGFENDLSEYLNIEGTTALSSGTAALHLAYKLAGICKDDIVLVQDLTFSATVNPIIYENAIPVFIDSERDSWNMDPRALKLALEKYKGKVKAVVPVHLYGVPAKMEEIVEICEEYGVKIIEDAAESLSATYKDKHTATFGDYAALSFNGNKLITTSGGGMLIAKDKADAQKASYWASQSKEPAPWYQHTEIGYNYRMSNIVAGIGRGQFLHLEDHKDLKVSIYERYKKGLEDQPISMNPYLSYTSPSFWLSAMLLDESCIERGITPEKVRLFLEEYNVESRHIWKPMHLQPFFQDYDYIKYEENSVTEDIFNRGLCLPSDIKMKAEDQETVIEMIKEALNQGKADIS